MDLELLLRMDKREGVFRLEAGCLECAFWQKDKRGRWRCVNADGEGYCRNCYKMWQKEEAEKCTR